MVKIFMTGDNHFGKKYSRYPELQETLIQSRYDSLRRCVQKAEEENCELFVVTGDLFDSVSVDKNTVKKVAEILAVFNGTVLVLVGNHDYYTEEKPLWRWFEETLRSMENNVILLKEFRPYAFSCAEEKVLVYPAFCQKKHSKENNLEWIRKTNLLSLQDAEGTEEAIQIGIAHGAIQGITPDKNQEYFLMTEEELLSIPMDVWLIGHTHVPYPSDLSETKESEGHKIFNAGTHEQLDLANNTEGLGFILSIQKKDGKSFIKARKYRCGRIRYYDLKVTVQSHEGETLREALDKCLKQEIRTKKEDAVVRVTASGTLSPKEYESRRQIAQEQSEAFLSFEFDGSELTEEISVEKIRREFVETSFAARFLENLMGEPAELQMAYELLQDCKDRK